MSKTTKAIIGLSLVPVVLPFVGLLHLSRRHETRMFCRDFWKAFYTDLDTVLKSDFIWDAGTLFFIVLLGVLAVVNFIAGNWLIGGINLASALWMSINS